MRRLSTVVVLAVAVVVAVVPIGPGRASAVGPDAECEAAQLAAIGQRISTKLHCRAWAKLAGIEVPSECLRAADDQFFTLLVSMGPKCGDPGSLVDLGASADAIMSTAAAQVEVSTSVADPSGTWVTRTVVGTNPDEMDLTCGGPEEPVCPDVIAIIECRTQITLERDSTHQDSECQSSADSPVYFGPFHQEARGPIDRTTGEHSFAGTVEVSPSLVAHYKGEGVYSADGNSMSAITTAGLGGDWFWLAATSGERVTSEPH
jgi:hypothetical protein